MFKSETLLLAKQSDKTPNRLYHVLMVTGVYPSHEQPHSGTFIKSQVESLKKAGVTVEILHPGPGPMPLRYVRATLQVFLKTLTGRFDIIHGHFGLWCFATRMQWTTPIVVSFLGDDLLGKPSVRGGFTRKSKLVISVSRWLCSRVDAVIVKSEEMKKVAFAHNAFISVIPNGVDFDLFRPIPRTEARDALRWDQNRYYVLFGNDPMIPRKNYALAQATVERLQQKGIDVQLIVNNGLPQEEVVLHMNACNALLLTSILEGSPNIVKEAMACNVLTLVMYCKLLVERWVVVFVAVILICLLLDWKKLYII